MFRKVLGVGIVSAVLAIQLSIVTADEAVAKSQKPFTTWHKASSWQGFKIVKSGSHNRSYVRN